MASWLQNNGLIAGPRSSQSQDTGVNTGALLRTLLDE